MVLSSPSSFGNRFHWPPLLSRKMMPLSICRGTERLRPRALGGSSSRMIGSDPFSEARPVLSQMVSSVSCFPVRSLPMLLEKPYESSWNPINAFVVQILR